MTFLPLFPLPFGGVYPLHASGAVRAVFPPVGFWEEERPADSAAFPASPAQEGGFQCFIKGQDSGGKPAAVKVEAATQTLATITLQNYFRMYHKLSGMTGTAETEAGELWDIYKLDVVVIPTNRPIARKDMNDRVYKTKREKYKAVIEEIEEMVKEGRPVLVGTTSVEISEMLS